MKNRPVDEVPDPGVVGSDEAALDAEREAVGALEPQEVGRDRRQLPHNHLLDSAAAAEEGGEVSEARVGRECGLDASRKRRRDPPTVFSRISV
jgi:hypothetical protein